MSSSMRSLGTRSDDGLLSEPRAFLHLKVADGLELVI